MKGERKCLRKGRLLGLRHVLWKFVRVGKGFSAVSVSLFLFVRNRNSAIVLQVVEFGEAEIKQNDFWFGFEFAFIKTANQSYCLGDGRTLPFFSKVKPSIVYARYEHPGYKRLPS